MRQPDEVPLMIAKLYDLFIHARIAMIIAINLIVNNVTTVTHDAALIIVIDPKKKIK